VEHHGTLGEASEFAAQKLTGRILLAEDHHDVQGLVRVLLTSAGLEVELADNGQVACEMALRSRDVGRPFDIILMDVQMPELDGHAATRRLRGEGWTGPIVALTAHAMRGDRERCLEAGCDGYISKPIDQHELLACLIQYLEPQAADSPAQEMAAESAPPNPPSPIGREPFGDGQPAQAEDDHPPAPGRPMGAGFVDESVLNNLVNQFRGELGDHADAVEQAFRQGDIAQVEHLAHQLKGAAGMYGLTHVSQIAWQLQQAAEGGSADGLDGLVERLTTACRREAGVP
jgi:CheY-like chemotaxis protein/HPt (histidine-containing phosphotransfer) domain-containing protein